MASTNTDKILREVQGDVVVGLPKHKEHFFFFAIKDSGIDRFKSALKTLEVCNGQEVLDKKEEIRQTPKGQLVKAPFLNIAFSKTGLTKCGLLEELGEDPSALSALQRHGGPGKTRFEIGQLACAKSLGDSGKDTEDGGFDPDWKFALKNQIDGLILVTGEGWPTVNEMLAKALASFGDSIREVYSLKGSVRPGRARGHEHFGWLDDISNPAVKGVGIDGTGQVLPGQMEVDPGVFLCGMDGDPMKDQRPSWAECGSFLVFRQLEQLVPEFHKYLSEQSAALYNDSSPEGCHRLGAHLVGRWKSGAPLQITPDRDDEKLGKDKFRNNKFDFSQDRGDRGQELCPYSSHIRKTNPRGDLNRRFGPGTVEQHAIRRAGITYGPELSESEIHDKATEHERGLAFVCYQSDIATGFEFIQLTWANDPTFMFGKELQQGDPGFKGDSELPIGFDPLIGQRSKPEDRAGSRDTWGTENGMKLRGMPEFVCSRGGGYFFSPSIPTLRKIGESCS